MARHGGHDGRKDYMTGEQVLRYLFLVDRRLTILTSGADWKPEYNQELRSIDKEIRGLKPLLNEERRKYEAEGQ